MQSLSSVRRNFRNGAPGISARLERGSALVEFAIVLPLLVVFVVGIYDFSGAFNQKQKIAQAAQEGAIIAGAQPMNDIEPGNVNPDSLQPVVAAIFNSLAGSGVLPNANTGAGCNMPPPAPSQAAGPLTWTYTISGCGYNSGDQLIITIQRGWQNPPAVGTVVTVQNPYHWRFGSAIQLLFSGSNGYSTPTELTETATVLNQM